MSGVSSYAKPIVCECSWRRHAAAAEAELHEQQSISEQKHASARTCENEAIQQSTFACTKDATWRIYSKCIAQAMAATIWTQEASKSALQALQHRNEAAQLQSRLDQAIQVHHACMNACFVVTSGVGPLCVVHKSAMHEACRLHQFLPS